LLVKQLGVDRTVAIVEDGAYVDLFETVGVDVAISPREVTAEEIIRFTKERRAENVSLIQDDKAEVVEIEIDEESHLAGQAIRDAVAELPQGIVVGAITRDDTFITPRGDTVIEPRDHVVLFAYADIVDDVLARI
ncbi:MAG: TrkA C-terminal domain-containing protein, partial [Haloarculaceae archaeon]